jgi:hypothetical protein
MTTARETFGGWLAKQEQRPDEVGEMARHWAGIKNEYPKVRALPSIQRELQARGDLNAGSPVAGWWAATIEAYRGKDTPAPSMGAVPDGPVLDAETQVMVAQAAEVRHGTHALLALVSAKLDWLHEALMTPPGTEFPPWPELADFEPVADLGFDWDRLHEHADFEAGPEASDG